MATEGIRLSGWALTLGASSGFGEAVSLALAREGLTIFGVALGLKATLVNAQRILVYWTQEVVGRGLMGGGGRIYAMTSSGGTRVLPHYGPVSAAKAALESHIRQLAAELAPRGIAANSIRAGVTDTPALQKIPGHDAIIEQARRRNPSGRMTTPEDVAPAIVVLSHPDAYWITGNVIGVDGGEDIVG